MRTRNLYLALLLTGAVGFGGCVSRAIKEGVGVATGAKGSFSESPAMGPAGAKLLSGYRSFQVGRIEDGFKGRTPKQLMELLPMEIRNHLLKEKLPIRGGGRALEIHVNILYYEAAGSMGQVFGPLEEVVAEVQLVDKSTRKVVGNAICVGRSDATATQGVDQKAQGLAKGIVSWIRSRYPEQ